jgi:hypothetical protein
MLLPSSIPSAVATQVSAALNTHAAAISFLDGAAGVVAALEHAYLSFIHNRSDYFLVIGAEEACEPMVRALSVLNDDRPIVDGAVGFLLSRRPLSADDWQLQVAANVPAGSPVELEPEWSECKPFDVVAGNHLTAYTSLHLPYAVHAALSQRRPRTLIRCSLRGRGELVVGFRGEWLHVAAPRSENQALLCS